jgi:Mn-dependent DtxR family transcriptional regulator
MSRFSVIPSRVIEDDRFSITHLRVLIFICANIEENSSEASITRKSIAERLNISTARVSQITKDLSNFGYLNVCRVYNEYGGQSANGYSVIWC